MSARYIGVDVGGTNVVAGLVDEERRVLARAKAKAAGAKSDAALAGLIARLAREAAAEGGAAPEEIGGIGIGSPGVLRPGDGLVLYSCNTPLGPTELLAPLREAWNAPVFLGNDADCAALCEAAPGGAVHGCRSAVVVTLGTGVGGAYVQDGVLWRGHNGCAMEAGHMTVRADGRRCPCGRRGCWEQYASATALKRMTREAMRKDRESLLWTLAAENGGKVGGRLAFEAMRRGDRTAKRVTDAYLFYLAAGVCNLINLLQPDRLCLAGGVAGERDEDLLYPLRERVSREEAARCGLPRTEIVKAARGGDAGVVGAAMLCMNH
ncbi:MAG TPA: ROK family protein [Oscillospiraceae bacterium]|nr:ROK family protein [Oscillospiraceae bacterium]